MSLRLKNNHMEIKWKRWKKKEWFGEMKGVTSQIMWSVILERKLELRPKEWEVSHVTRGESIFWWVNKVHEDLGGMSLWVWGTEPSRDWRVIKGGVRGSDPGKELAVPLGTSQKLLLRYNWHWDSFKRWDLKGVNRSWECSVLMSSPPEWVPDRKIDPHFLPRTHVCLLAP